MPPEQVFKTLAVKGDRNGVAVAVIPGNYELDFKALAQLTGDRKMEMLPLKEVQSVTGYIRGGVTALGMKKDYPVFADETMELWERSASPLGSADGRSLSRPPITCAQPARRWVRSRARSRSPGGSKAVQRSDEPARCKNCVKGHPWLGPTYAKTIPLGRHLRASYCSNFRNAGSSSGSSKLNPASSRRLGITRWLASSISSAISPPTRAGRRREAEQRRPV